MLVFYLTVYQQTFQMRDLYFFTNKLEYSGLNIRNASFGFSSPNITILLTSHFIRIASISKIGIKITIASVRGDFKKISTAL
jgi:hypothetical protein